MNRRFEGKAVAKAVDCLGGLGVVVANAGAAAPLVTITLPNAE